MQRAFSFRQINNGIPSVVFPLLCPVRERDWLEGWNYKMVHSKSGLIEPGCVFTTKSEHTTTTWCVTIHDALSHRVEFVRITAGEMVVRIKIALALHGSDQTQVHITYEYTPLNEKQTAYVNGALEQDFRTSMAFWERAINHYLETGTMLRRNV